MFGAICLVTAFTHIQYKLSQNRTIFYYKKFEVPIIICANVLCVIAFDKFITKKIKLILYVLLVQRKNNHGIS